MTLQGNKRSIKYFFFCGHASVQQDTNQECTVFLRTFVSHHRIWTFAPSFFSIYDINRPDFFPSENAENITHSTIIDFANKITVCTFENGKNIPNFSVKTLCHAIDFALVPLNKIMTVKHYNGIHNMIVMKRNLRYIAQQTRAIKYAIALYKNQSRRQIVPNVIYCVIKQLAGHCCRSLQQYAHKLLYLM